MCHQEAMWDLVLEKVDSRKSPPPPTIFLRFVICQKEVICCLFLASVSILTVISSPLWMLLYRLDGWYFSSKLMLLKIPSQQPKSQYQDFPCLASITNFSVPLKLSIISMSLLVALFRQVSLIPSQPSSTSAQMCLGLYCLHVCTERHSLPPRTVAVI